jgi:AraC-like DNA-binding protein
MKISFSNYVTHVRLKESERLLLISDENVTDIAQAVGFSTSAYFIAKFREHYGITPYRYRFVWREKSKEGLVLDNSQST